MTDALIRVENLTIGWDDVVLQKDANFEVERGDIFVILGASGCGKSTMLRHLVGLEYPLAGEIVIEGAQKVGPDDRRPTFGMMFQSGALLGSMTVGENVALPLQEWTDLPPEAVWAIVQAKLRLVGMQGTEDKLPSELSGGMKKRAAIARAMALESELMFLDEPSSGLDPSTAAELDDLLLILNQRLGMTLVLVSHDLDSILKIGKRCIMLDKKDKAIIASGDPRKLRDECDDPRVRSFFNRMPQGAA
jgi:phospholipid/cholesterol/gamma-HCH transport system ATP-binding protein